MRCWSSRPPPLDLHLAREAVGDHPARLATEEELARDFAGYQLGALPIVGRRQLETVLAGYMAHYNQHRPHRSLGMSHRWELSPHPLQRLEFG